MEPELYSESQQGYCTTARTDPTYGQKSAFPGLEGNNSVDELFYGPANDGLEYLRMVRTEAKGVPNILIAPEESTGTEHQHPDSGSDLRGWYSDGAYTAVPLPRDGSERRREWEYEPGDFDPGEEEEDTRSADTQDMCYSSVLERFAQLRVVLRTGPPRSDAFGSIVKRGSRQVSQVTDASSTKAVWKSTLRCTAPTARYLHSLGQDAAILAIARLEHVVTVTTMLRDTHGRNLGAWSWGLLARCRDVGELGSEEVAVLRGLAKKALYVSNQLRLKTTSGAMSEDDIASECTEGMGDEPIEDRGTTEEHSGEPMEADAEYSSAKDITAPKLEKQQSESKSSKLSAGSLTEEDGREDPARNRLQVDEDATVRDMNIDPEHGIEETRRRAFATLDIIVTIVGELYGQRDLLTARKAW